MPWDCAIVEDTPERVSIRFWVRTYRTPFFFEKTLTLRSGSPVLEIDEALTNEAEERMHCVWGQHIALGPPFLSGDCFIDLPGGRLLTHPVDWDPGNRLKPGFDGPWPWAERKDGARVDMRRITPKDERVHEMSYVTDMPDGWYAVTNGRRGVGLGVAFPQDLFRYLWYWQSLGGGYGYPWYGRTYNVGIEPFTSYTNEGLATGGRERHGADPGARRAGRGLAQGRRVHGIEGRRKDQPRRLGRPAYLAPCPADSWVNPPRRESLLP